MSDQQILETLIQRVDELEKGQRNAAAQNPLFTILNPNSPAQLTGNVNDYDPGNYDFLFMTSDASRTITGISSGYNGRVLYIYNVGTQNIVLAHASASSSADNRIVTQSASNLTISPRNGVLLVYYLFLAGSGFNNWKVILSS